MEQLVESEDTTGNEIEDYAVTEIIIIPLGFLLHGKYTY